MSKRGYKGWPIRRPPSAHQPIHPYIDKGLTNRIGDPICAGCGRVRNTYVHKLFVDWYKREERDMAKQEEEESKVILSFADSIAEIADDHMRRVLWRALLIVANTFESDAMRNMVFTGAEIGDIVRRFAMAAGPPRATESRESIS